MKDPLAEFIFYGFIFLGGVGIGLATGYHFERCMTQHDPRSCESFVRIISSLLTKK